MNAYCRPPGAPLGHKGGGHTLLLSVGAPPPLQKIHLKVNGLIFFIGELRVILMGKRQFVERLMISVYPFEYHVFAHIQTHYL